MILVAGSANLDFVVRAGHIPGPGETVLGRDFQTFPGGKGANQAVACARSGGVTTHLLAALGNDAFAQPIEASLGDAKVILRDVRIEEHPTGTAFICVSDDAENAITVAPGANAYLMPEHLVELRGFTHLLMQLETPVETVLAFATAARSAGLKVVLNAAPARSLAANLLAHIDILVVNEGELASIAAHDGSIAECLARIDVPTVVVTLGHRGCCARQYGQFHFQNAFSIEAVDTTAAGDTFCGAMTAALCRGKSLGEALHASSAASALACLTLGAQSSIPTQADVQAWLTHIQTQHNQDTTELQAFCGLHPGHPNYE
jgi:ribokinase